MPSARQREVFDNRVRDLLNQDKTEDEIAIILNRPINAVKDARRRIGIYRIAPSQAVEPNVVRAEEKKPRKYKVVVDGKEYWCLNEFFGIWER